MVDGPVVRHPSTALDALVDLLKLSLNLLLEVVRPCERCLAGGRHALRQVGKEWFLDPFIGVSQTALLFFLVLHPPADKALIQLSSITREGIFRLASQSPRYGQKHEWVAGEVSKLSWHSVVKGAEAEVLQKASYLVGSETKDLECLELRWGTGKLLDVWDETRPDETYMIVLLLLDKALEDHRAVALQMLGHFVERIEQKEDPTALGNP